MVAQPERAALALALTAEGAEAVFPVLKTRRFAQATKNETLTASQSLSRSYAVAILATSRLLMIA